MHAPPTPIRRRWTRVGSLHVHHREAGSPDAPPVLLVHGPIASSLPLERLLRELAPHARVLAPDLVGFGESDKLPRALDVDALADTLAAWVEETRLRRAVVVGTSYGSQVAVAFAERHPWHVDSLVLQGPTPEPGTRSARGQLRAALRDALHEPPSLLPVLFARDCLAAGPRRVLGMLRHLMHDPPERRLPHVHAPVLIVLGDRDGLASVAWARRLAALAPHGRVVVVPGAAHAMGYHRPRDLVQAMRPLLRGRPSAAAGAAHAFMRDERLV